MSFPGEDGVPVQLQTLPSSLSLELPSSLSLNDEVYIYQAVVSKQHQLVNAMDFIRITADHFHVSNASMFSYLCISLHEDIYLCLFLFLMQLAEYAMLLFCITFKSRALCFVRWLERMW